MNTFWRVSGVNHHTQMRTYAEKLKDPRWQKRRLEVLQRDGFKCLVCGTETETLHVHHLAYFRGEPWDTPTSYLETLCWLCHAARTEMDSIECWAIRTRPSVYVVTDDLRNAVNDQTP